MSVYLGIMNGELKEPTVKPTTPGIVNVYAGSKKEAYSIIRTYWQTAFPGTFKDELDDDALDVSYPDLRAGPYKTRTPREPSDFVDPVTHEHKPLWKVRFSTDKRESLTEKAFAYISQLTQIPVEMCWFYDPDDVRSDQKELLYLGKTYPLLNDADL